MFNKKLSCVAAEWEQIQKIIPILKEMEYTDMHLRYEDCDIWVLEWHDPSLDGWLFYCLDQDEVSSLAEKGEVV